MAFIFFFLKKFEKVEKTVFLGLNFSYTVLYPLYSDLELIFGIRKWPSNKKFAIFDGCVDKRGRVGCQKNLLA